MSEYMKTKPCLNCGKVAVEVISYLKRPNGERMGWYCNFCRNWDQATGRERKV
jgi:hypothetical protein